MISYLEGHIVANDDRSIVLKCGPTGWRVNCGPNMLDTVRRNGDTVKIFTYLRSREDGQELYGFPSFEVLQCAELLMDVSGVGPRTAQLIVDTLPIEVITTAVLQGTSDPFERISGIGSRLAQKIVIELKPKVAKMKLVSSNVDLTALGEDDDVIEALKTLGYKRREAQDALKKLPKDITGAGRRIEEALKILGRGPRS
jgi:Holliday junction DNA helicase RuvA